MSQIEIAQIIEQIKQEISVDSNVRNRISIRAVERIAGVSNGTILKTLNTFNSEPSKLAQKIQLQGISIDCWRTNGISDEVIYLILEYYAFEAGKRCTQRARQAIKHFSKYKNFDGFVNSEFTAGHYSPKNRVKLSFLEKIEKMSHPVVEVNTPVGKIDILTDYEIIEVKKASAWKSAVGQILVYGHYYPNHQKRIHLFGECSVRTKQIIHTHCDQFNIQLTWQ
ncbi:hypothetical protein GS682_30870 [Nostoc sp. B(2019)]|nr:hypothetical protein [Nostoc sp. B(2019)]